MNTADASAIAKHTLAKLQRAWNDADGTAFGAPFADDAAFVDIRGGGHRGRES